MQTREKIEPKHKNSLKILINRINLANTIDQDQFIYFIQFDVEELKTYMHIMQDPNTIK